MKRVRRDMENAIPTSFNTDATINARARYGMSGGYSVEGASGTVINQTISVTTPKALSEKEMARELHNLSRQLALQM